jgi:hypothetical protein
MTHGAEATVMDDLRKPVDLGGLPGLGQIGIVVQDTQEAMAAYSTFLGVPRWFRSRTEHRETLYRGQRVDLELDIVVGYAGRVQIELGRVVSGGPDNVYHQVLGTDGRGFHHFGFIVRRIDDHLARIERSGIEVLQASTIRNKGGVVIRTAFLDTMESCGFLTELIEARLRGVSVGMPQWLARIGTVMGSTEMLEVT